MINDNENEAVKWKIDHIDMTYTPRSRNGHKYTKCEMCLSIIIPKAIPKQRLKLNSWRI